MKKYIINVDERVDFKKIDKVAKRGKPRALQNLIVIETDLSKSELEQIPGILLVEEEQRDTPDEIQVQRRPASWFLPSASNSAPDYQYTKTGKGTSIYIMDSGIRLSHAEFSGRVKETIYSYDGLDYGGAVEAPNHGTMCASCAAGNVHGIAKEANIYNVRYDWTNINGIKALDSILAHYRANPFPAVLSMSFSSESSIYIASLDQLAREGMVLVASAGNYGEPFPRWPAMRNDVIAVAACDRNLFPSVWNDTQSTNYGREIDIWAGGSDGRAASYASDTATGYADGTSSACPLVAGAVSLILENSNKLTSYTQVLETKSFLLNKSRKNVITYPSSIYNDTPNRYLYTMSANEPIPGITPIEDIAPVDKKKSTNTLLYVAAGALLLIALIYILQ